MAENFIWGGNIIPYPETGDEAWGIEATATIAAINQYCIQKTGGTYSLTADLNFGINFGLKSKYYKSLNASPAQSGVLRLGFTDSVAWRNFGDSGDLALTVNAAGQLLFDGVVISTGTGSSGNVVGPVSSTNGAIATYGGTSGTQLLNTPVIIDNSGNVTGVGTLSANTLNAVTLGSLNTGTIATLSGTILNYSDLYLNHTSGGTNVGITTFAVNGTNTGQINACINPSIASLQVIGNPSLFLCGSAGTQGILINAAGRVMLNTGSDNGTSALQVNGDITATTLNVAGTGSIGTVSATQAFVTTGNINTLDCSTQLTAPTLGSNDNSNKVATTAYVTSKIGAGGGIKAWASVQGNTSIIAASNIASVTYVGGATYGVFFSTPMVDNGYSVEIAVGMYGIISGSNGTYWIVRLDYGKTVNGFYVTFVQHGSQLNPDQFFVQIVR